MPISTAFEEAAASLCAQAEQLDQLRRQVTEAQRTGGKLDPVLLAEFARAQQLFLKARIEHEHHRQVCQWEEEALAAEEVASAREVAIDTLRVQSSPATNRGKPLLSQSHGFWWTVVIILYCAWLSDLLFGALH